MIHAFAAHGLDSSPSIAMVGTEGVEPFVDRLSSDCTEPLCYVPSSLPFSTPQGEGAIKLAALDIPFGDTVSRGGEFCHLGLLVPGQALYYLSYTPLVPAERIELPYSGPKPDALPLSDTGMVPEARFERTTNGFRNRCATIAPLGISASLQSRTGPSASSAQRSSHESLRGICGTWHVPPLCPLLRFHRSTEGVARELNPD